MVHLPGPPHVERELRHPLPVDAARGLPPERRRRPPQFGESPVRRAPSTGRAPAPPSPAAARRPAPAPPTRRPPPRARRSAHSPASVTDAARSTCLHSCCSFHVPLRDGPRSSKKSARVHVVRPHVSRRRETALAPSVRRHTHSSAPARARRRARPAIRRSFFRGARPCRPAGRASGRRGERLAVVDRDWDASIGSLLRVSRRHLARREASQSTSPRGAASRRKRRPSPPGRGVRGGPLDARARASPGIESSRYRRSSPCPGPALVLSALLVAVALVPGAAAQAPAPAPVRLAIAGLTHGHVHGILGARTRRRGIVGDRGDERRARRAVREALRRRRSRCSSTTLAAMLDRVKPEAVAAFGPTERPPRASSRPARRARST